MFQVTTLLGFVTNPRDERITHRNVGDAAVALICREPVVVISAEAALCVLMLCGADQPTATRRVELALLGALDVHSGRQIAC